MKTITFKLMKFILLIEVIVLGLGGCTHAKPAPTTRDARSYYRHYDFPGPDAPTIYKI